MIERTRRIRFVACCGVALLLAACGERATGTGNTNWQVDCESDSQCDDDLACSCNLCGPRCDGTIECNDNRAPTCHESASDSDPDSGASGSSASSSSDGGSTEPTSTQPDATDTPPITTCPASATGAVEPTVVHSRFQRIEDVEELGHLLVDEERIYWMDWEGRVQSQRVPLDFGPEPLLPIELRAAQSEPLTPIGEMVADETTLYWAEASVEPPGAVLEPSPPPPPGRIFAADKAGGGVELLLESPDQTYRVLAVRDDTLLLRVDYGAPGLYAFSLTTRELEPWVPDLGTDDPRVVGDLMYWREPNPDPSDETEYSDDLFRANLDGSNTQFVAKIRGEFSVFDDLVLWQDERTHFDPLVLDQNFVALAQNTGCQWRLSHVGETISYRYVADDTHVYWHSYNGLAAISSDDTELPKSPLIRVHLADNRLEEIVVPGFDSDLYARIWAQTDDKLFVMGNAGFIAIEKTTDADVPEPDDTCIWGVDNLLAEVGETASARVSCGHFNSAETDLVADAFTCFESAPADPGAQFTVNNCIDCRIPTTYVSTPSGNLYQILLEADFFGDEMREARVERCLDFDLSETGITCLEPEELYSCLEPLREE